MNRAERSAQSKSIKPSRRRRFIARPWGKVTVALLGVVLLIAIVYARAFFTLDSSTFSRAIVWVDADVDDYRRFHARGIDAPTDPYVYKKGPGYPSGLPEDVALPTGNDDLELACNPLFVADCRGRWSS